jgi:hypothetical protein
VTTSSRTSPGFGGSLAVVPLLVASVLLIQTSDRISFGFEDQPHSRTVLMNP